jgi:methanethiol S-methyltransferase
VQPAVKVAIATGAFAALHSALASARVKDAVAARAPFGRNLYRTAYNTQAVLAFGALVWYIGRRPRRTIYRAGGVTAGVLRLGQLAGIVFGVAAARATGVAKLAGLDNLAAALTGRPAVTPPAAQGPESGADGVLRTHGPFRLSRHPLNLAPLAPFWLAPHMTTRRLAFNLVATVYLVLGSLHEEQRLLKQYGQAYEQYRASGVPFYLPRVYGRSAVYARSSQRDPALPDGAECC